MRGNTIGKVFRLTTFGESHGAYIGGVIDGCPSGLTINTQEIIDDLRRRKPEALPGATKRHEEDIVNFLSGHANMQTTGQPIAFIIANEAHQPQDYEALRDVYRPSHADYAWEKKFGIHDYRGGGRASARETVARVVGGSIAKVLLSEQNIAVTAWVEQIGNIAMKKSTSIPRRTEIYGHVLRCPDYQAADKMAELIACVEKEGDTLGGVAAVGITGVPPGWGEPVFDKLHAELGKALLSIPSVKGVAFGSGFEGVAMRGSEHNDLFVIKEDKVSTQTNYSGGIQGGVSNGEDIFIRIAFKPISSIAQPQKSIDKSMNTVDIDLSSGRHDVCVVPRALPIVEAMISLVLADMFLRNKSVT